ncbi:MAG: DUF4389 domain-containing protein [Gammaproteobacteria bacterium]|nr:DUF4389 domain-containing protein [Gammaproteobacteria bacterium]
MDDEIKQKLTNTNTWIRGLYMLLFLVVLGVTKFIVGALVVFQFLSTLFTGSCNERLVEFGQNLAQYIAQIVLFVCYGTEEKPYPFSDWPTSSLINTTVNTAPKTKTKKKTTTKKTADTEEEGAPPSNAVHIETNPDEPIKYQ